MPLNLLAEMWKRGGPKVEQFSMCNSPVERLSLTSYLMGGVSAIFHMDRIDISKPYEGVSDYNNQDIASITYPNLEL